MGWDWYPTDLPVGLLVYEEGSYYLKTLGDGKYWIKGGTDSPENFLAYDGFVNTTGRDDKPEWFHDYDQHIADWNNGDPDWDGGKGKGIIGSLNYLSSKHVNSIYVLLMNIGGDGQDVWPYSGTIDRAGAIGNDNIHFDIAKLTQWEVVFGHAQRKGINLNLVLGEGETNNKRELDNAQLGTERKLYYREMIARFGHHNALQWMLCEEYDGGGGISVPPDMVKSWAQYIKDVDAYGHPVSVHNGHEEALEPFFGDDRFDLTSYQYHKRTDYPINFYGSRVEMLRGQVAAAGRIIPIFIDEPETVGLSDDESVVYEDGWLLNFGQVKIRKEVLYPIYFSGGSVEFILEEMLATDDFSCYESLWNYMYYARKFMEENLSFHEMQPHDELLTGEARHGDVLARIGTKYAIYLPEAQNTGSLDLTGCFHTFTRRWYNPRTGNFEGTATVINGGGIVSLGPPPGEPTEDWVVLLEANTVARVTAGRIVAYGFTDGSGDQVTDRITPALNLTIQNMTKVSWGAGFLAINTGLGPGTPNPPGRFNGTIISAPGTLATKLYDAVTNTRAITVEVWVRPELDDIGGPARIVTYSHPVEGGGLRNFTLGPQNTMYASRLRSNATSANGIPTFNESDTEPGSVVPGALQHVVFTRDAAGIEKIYVNGSLKNTLNNSGSTITGNANPDHNWDNTYEFSLANEHHPTDLQRRWPGELHLVVVYDRALNAAEVSQNYAAGADAEVVDGAYNTAPQVDAGCYQLLLWPDNTAQLNPIVTDDGYPEPAGLTYTWSKLSGPGNVTFSPSADIEDPCVTFSALGTYELNLNVFDGEKDTDDTVMIMFTTVRPMTFPGTDWIETTPESQGVDSAKLNAALAYLESQSGSSGITEVMVIRNGYLIWKGNNIDYKHNIASISKIFTSTCHGLLIDDGRCTLDDLAKDYESRFDCEYAEYGNITLRHLANFTSGYDAVGGTYGSQDPYDGSSTPFVPTTPAFAPGAMYSYWDDAMNMYGLVLTKISQGSLYDFFRQRIADPIGMDPGEWYWQDLGEVDGFTVFNTAGGIYITARELARLGHLFLNRGNWDGTQLISTDWVDEAISVQVPNTMEGRMDSTRQQRISVIGVGTYGYHWWANGILADGTRYFPDAPLGTYYRGGWPKQRMFIIPEWNMVIVRIGRDGNSTALPVDVRACWNTTLKMVGEAVTIENPTCQDVIDSGLLMIGDLTGPEGVPDCYVNLYDFAAFAGNWLRCNNPQDIGCENSF